ncbi:DUF1801 domain-containing protein [Flavobacterium psychroterrae]|uniref:DUF1801 domain-containing protein n=1 Tax=Flavobacterium psychroterrae TaxID=2133767 RepID=A0ABS5PAW8_9FLAO|nr:DUF1801 domain-containing protein [Flavobacterium psychroterrae]MBS7231435.1 DUF1801 domain-containing protein [Flavobacterium psychroterrae]
MAKNKTTETESSVADFINVIDDEIKRNDAFELAKIMKKISGLEPKMWGTGIIGFGSYHYKYDSGHEGDAPIIAFSPRKAAISLYLNIPVENREELLSQLGKHKSAKACIYIKKLTDIDIIALQNMISISLENSKKLYLSN